MSKKTMLFLLCCMLFFTCKKDKKSAVVLNVTGNYTLYSYQTNFGIGVNAVVTQYPCMAGNVVTLYGDSTSNQYYTRSDTCFVTPTHLKANGAQYFGLPTLGSIASTWRLKGSAIYITYPGNAKSLPGVISTVNNRLQMTLKDTTKSGSNTYFTTSILVRE